MCLAPTLPAPQRDPPASKSAVCAVAGVLHFGAFLQATKCFGIALGNIFGFHDTPLAPGSVLAAMPMFESLCNETVVTDARGRRRASRRSRA